MSLLELERIATSLTNGPEHFAKKLASTVGDGSLMVSDKSWEAVGVVLGETASAITPWLQVLALTKTRALKCFIDRGWN